MVVVIGLVSTSPNIFNIGYEQVLAGYKNGDFIKPMRRNEEKIYKKYEKIVKRIDMKKMDEEDVIMDNK